MEDVMLVMVCWTIQEAKGNSFQLLDASIASVACNLPVMSQNLATSGSLLGRPPGCFVHLATIIFLLPFLFLGSSKHQAMPNRIKRAATKTPLYR